MVEKSDKPRLRIFADYGMGAWLWGPYPDELERSQLMKDGEAWSYRWEAAGLEARKIAGAKDSAEIVPPGWDWDEWNAGGEQLAQRVRDAVGDGYEVVHIEQRDFV